MWNEKYLVKENGERLFVDCYFTDKLAPNIIYIQTPLISVTDLKECYESLSKYGFNIFALDLTGVGKSDGDVKDFSVEALIYDISTCIKYIKANYNDKIHFFGGTGTGGILAQAFVTTSDEIKSFAQYGVAIYNDISIFPNAKLMKILYPILKLISRIVPSKKIKFSAPSYNGKNAAKENKLYQDLLAKHPGGFDMNINLLTSILGLFVDKNSPLREVQTCPTLFFAPQHDRYFTRQYFKKYNEMLTIDKKMYIIDDAHSSYLWHAEEICKQVSDWFWKNN